MRVKALHKKSSFSHAKNKALRKIALAKFRDEVPRRKSQFTHSYANVPYDPDYQPSIAVTSQACDDKLLEKGEHSQQKKHRVQRDHVQLEEIDSHSGLSDSVQLPVSKKGGHGIESTTSTEIISSQGRRVTRSSTRVGRSQREEEMMLSIRSVKKNSTQSLRDGERNQQSPSMDKQKSTPGRSKLVTSRSVSSGMAGTSPVSSGRMGTSPVSSGRTGTFQMEQQKKSLSAQSKKSLSAQPKKSLSAIPKQQKKNSLDGKSGKSVALLKILTDCSTGFFCELCSLVFRDSDSFVMHLNNHESFEEYMLNQEHIHNLDAYQEGGATAGVCHEVDMENDEKDGTTPCENMLTDENPNEEYILNREAIENLEVSKEDSDTSGNHHEPDMEQSEKDGPTFSENMATDEYQHEEYFLNLEANDNVASREEDPDTIGDQRETAVIKVEEDGATLTENMTTDEDRDENCILNRKVIDNVETSGEGNSDMMGDQRETHMEQAEEDGTGITVNMVTDEGKKRMKKRGKKRRKEKNENADEQLAETPAPTRTNSLLVKIPGIVSMTPADLTGSEALKCFLCDLEFPSYQSISTHYNSSHSDIVSYKCLECDELFASFSDIRNHMRSHGYSCNVCGKVFYVLLTLLNHKMGHLEGTNPHKCAVCRNGFPSALILENHVKLVHPNVKPDFPCTLCKERFTKRAELISHQSLHTGIKPYLCCMCPKAFSSKTEAKIHRVSHKSVVAFQCKVCPSKFTEKRLLAAHKRTHVSEKPYVCQTCGDSFRLRKALDRHTTFRHLEGNSDRSDAEVEPKPQAVNLHRAQALVPKRKRPNRTHVLCPICGDDSVGTKLKRHMLTHTDYRPFECRFCGKRFRQAFNLKIHTNLHTGDKPYKCKLCGVGFPSAAGLVSHEIYKHEALAAQKKAERETKRNVTQGGSQQGSSLEVLQPTQNIPAKSSSPFVKVQNNRAVNVQAQNGSPPKQEKTKAQKRKAKAQRQKAKAQRVPAPDVQVRSNPKRRNVKAEHVPAQDVQEQSNPAKNVQVKNNPKQRKVKGQRYPAPDIQEKRDPARKRLKVKAASTSKR